MQLMIYKCYTTIMGHNKYHIQHLVKPNIGTLKAPVAIQ